MFLLKGDRSTVRSGPCFHMDTKSCCSQPEECTHSPHWALFHQGRGKDSLWGKTPGARGDAEWELSSSIRGGQRTSHESANKADLVKGPTLLQMHKNREYDEVQFVFWQQGLAERKEKDGWEGIQDTFWRVDLLHELSEGIKSLMNGLLEARGLSEKGSGAGQRVAVTRGLMWGASWAPCVH